MKTTYVVRYKYYQYNTGKADNGFYVGEDEFTDLEEARTFSRKIKRLCQDDHKNANNQYSYKVLNLEGYLVSCVGIFEVTEKLLEK